MIPRLSTVLLLTLLAVAAARDVVAQPRAGSQLEPDENACAMCHGEKELWVSDPPHEDDRPHLYVPAEQFADDVHWQKGVNCHDCHGGDPSVLDPGDLHAKEDGFRELADVKKSCGDCHQDQRIKLHKENEAHADAGPVDESGQATPLDCGACHGEKGHGILPVRDSRSPVFLDNQVKLCGACHEKHLDEYRKSVHGHGLEQSGLLVTAVCADCHGAHGIYPASLEQSTLHADNVAATCAKCHWLIEERIKQSVHGSGNGPGAVSEKAAPGGKVKRKASCTDCHYGHDLPHPRTVRFRQRLPGRCGHCHEELSQGYGMSLHGELTELGYAPAADCSDCHGAHDILAISNPASRLAVGENRLQTCRKCHPYAVPSFCDFNPHADHKDAQSYPVLNATYLGMEVLIYSVFAVFGIHTVFWFVRSLVHVLRHGRPKRLAVGSPAYVRFEPIHRVLHAIVIVSFLGLALTGLPLRYSDQPWAHILARALGGFPSTRVWHRICAVFTIGYFVAHLVWISRRMLQCLGRGTGWKEVLFGPDSPVPRPKDLVDIFRMARWFVGLGPKPVFERWTYWEKFDYWAVFWGVAIIGTSGLMLWFPNAFSRILSGEVLNVAKIVHSEEALLATGFIFAIHFFATHLRPEKFPMDMAILSGMVSEEELREERPEFLERMRRKGKLDQLRAESPSRNELLLITAGGFLAVAVGLGLFVGILLAVFGA